MIYVLDRIERRIRARIKSLEKSDCCGAVSGYKGALLIIKQEKNSKGGGGVNESRNKTI